MPPVTITGTAAAPPYLQDIRAQPEALARLLDAGLPGESRELLADIGSFGRIVLTGMGASLFALHPAFLRLADAGLPVWCVETAELLGPAGGLVTSDTLLWVTSQSGASAEVGALLDGLGSARPRVLGMTDDVDSPLGRAADVVVELHSGDERTVSTRSYVNSLAAAALAVSCALGRAADPSLRDAPARLAGYLADWDAHRDALAAAVPEETIFLLGRGASLAAALTGALITKEAARTAVEGMSAPQFRHGPLELAGPGVAALVLAGDPADAPRNRRLVDDLAAVGANAVWLDTAVDPGAPALPRLEGPDSRPLAEILPMQLLSVVLAERRGAEPGAFRQIGKVTTTL